ncbi:MAG: hypothetical protein ABI134_25040, partial [Byssovorax sp.]
MQAASARERDIIFKRVVNDNAQSRPNWEQRPCMLQGRRRMHEAKITTADMNIGKHLDRVSTVNKNGHPHSELAITIAHHVHPWFTLSSYSIKNDRKSNGNDTPFGLRKRETVKGPHNTRKHSSILHIRGVQIPPCMGLVPVPVPVP